MLIVSVSSNVEIEKTIKEVRIQMAEFFKKNNFLIGLSIDGPKEIHDNGTSL